ncbi:hypothetical protein DV738_g3269, partial [Chaetothyriales sp. CBS 135597]
MAMAMADSRPAARVLAYIDETVEGINRELRASPVGKPSVSLKRISQLKARQQPDGQVCWEIVSRPARYYFPGRTKDEARRFGKAIRQDVIVTKRDIFYRDPGLFIKQETVDRFIEDIAHTCDVQRIDLHVVASPRGLVVGLSKSSEPETTPISLDDRSVDHLKWILVVEKDASGHEICTSLKLTENRQLFSRCRIKPGIRMPVSALVSLLPYRPEPILLLLSDKLQAKGFPDLATLHFLRMVLDNPTFSGPVFGLFDMDPYGLEILRCYRTGSKISLGNTHKTVPEMRWLGLKLEHLATKDVTVLGLTMKDRSRAKNMLEIMTLANGEVVPGTAECRVEAQRMLMAGKKAEIPTAESVVDMARWLEDEMAKRVMEARQP